MKPSPAVCTLLALLPVAGLATAAPAPADYDGAITLVAQRGPDYLGSRDYGVSLRPGFYVRWGRVSVSSGGGWAAIKSDYDVRGLGIDLTRSERFHASLGLRVDSGRRESDNAALAGLGEVKRTIRARIGATWHFTREWQLGAAWTIDAFGRGGGNLVEIKVLQELPLSARLNLSTGATLTAGGPKYMKTYFGVDAEQSARSGYPEYVPGASLRDLQLYTTLRADIGQDWVGLAGVGYSRALGDVLDSPMTRKASAWTMTAGLGWRF
jgi:outer membrane scaffolding protein for murein synthesis (MipA/OmpV family)